ncbi:MAG: hypothetical protein KDJ46_01360 [Rhodobiaceae bacterium]|nr:hypothetical protein [Rhodobiaceae bacterium]
MIGALNTALTGLQTFAGKAEKAAGEIVRSSGDVSQTQDAAPASGNASLAAPITGSPVNAVAPVPGDLEKAAVDLKLAEAGYKASARLVKSLTNMQDALLDVLR